MIPTNRVHRGWLGALLGCACMVSWATAQQPGRVPAAPRGGFDATARQHEKPSQGQVPNRVLYRVADRSGLVQKQPVSRFGPPQPNEHPLIPALRWAEEGQRTVDGIQDYSATMIKRERISGKLNDYHYLFVKVRHKPFSVYMYFTGPPSLRGQEVIYIEGQNTGKMWAHGTGLKQKMFGTVQLDPNGFIAMQGQRYPITELGIKNLVERLLEMGERDTKYGECEVSFLKGAKVDGRSCTCIQVVHPVPRKNFLFHIARIFVDDELQVPIRYAAYDWPSQPGGPPGLIEEYTYTNLRLNNGFTDGDFDVRNPNYAFNAR